MMTTTTENNQLPSTITEQGFKLFNDKSMSLNGITIIARKEDGYINLNQLCQSGGKKYKHWKETSKSKAFLIELEKDLKQDEEQVQNSRVVITTLEF